MLISLGEIDDLFEYVDDYDDENDEDGDTPSQQHNTLLTLNAANNTLSDLITLTTSTPTHLFHSSDPSTNGDTPH